MRTKRHAIAAAAALTLTVSGCGGMGQNETAGSLIGGAVGAVVGHQFGDGTGQIAATALGAIIGAMVGGHVGESLDADSKGQAKAAAQRALDSAEVGQPIQWHNPSNGGGAASGAIEITRLGRDANGRECREFVHMVKVDGREEQEYGTACRDAGGDWKLVQTI